MSKKKVNLSAIDDILGGTNESMESSAQVETTPQKKVGRPKEEEYEARTFRVRKDLADKLRIISMVEGRKQKDILDFALGEIIARYETKKGVIDISKDYGKGEVADIF